MRLPFLRSLRSATPADQPAPRRGRAAAAATTTTATIDDSAVQTARTRARQRLVGALVLLVIAIVGFPLLFETQPRPLPVDTPIEVARHPDGTVRQGAIQPVTQQPEPAALPPTMPPPDAGNEVAGGQAATAPAPASAPAAADARTATSAGAARPPAVLPTTATPAAASRPATAAAPKPAPTAPPQTAAIESPRQPSVVVSTLPQPRLSASADTATTVPPLTPAPAAAASAAGRYVVQVGAFNDNTKLNDARSKVEKLGLKTYTQPVDTPTGRRTRVRAGPFATRDEADAAAAKIKRSGLPANILVL